MNCLFFSSYGSNGRGIAYIAFYWRLSVVLSQNFVSMIPYELIPRCTYPYALVYHKPIYSFLISSAD
jgi:hypothetical protein